MIKESLQLFLGREVKQLTKIIDESNVDWDAELATLLSEESALV
jgi:hypothetical protein